MTLQDAMLKKLLCKCLLQVNLKSAPNWMQLHQHGSQTLTGYNSTYGHTHIDLIGISVKHSYVQFAKAKILSNTFMDNDPYHCKQFSMTAN